jgi:hypothetical protein
MISELILNGNETDSLICQDRKIVIEEWALLKIYVDLRDCSRNIIEFNLQTGYIHQKICL